MENYKQKYEAALERCKKEFNFNNLAYSHEEIKQKLEHIFPELAESKDERIRKEIICYLDREITLSNFGGDIATFKEWIDWLKKQGEQKCNYCEYFDGYDLCLHKKNFGSVTDESKENCKNNKFFIEKQGEQSNKVEPKFKVGDWVVYSFTDQIYQVNQIVEVKQLDDETWGYTLEDGSYFSGSWENSYRLWTIQDAKNGDVLVCDDDKRPFIFKGLLDLNHPNYLVAYCGIDYEDCFTVSSGVNWWTDDNVKPATKEQRDFLFQKMHKAGYIWDSNKKELIKYEQ